MNLEQVAHFIEHPQELTLSDAPALHALSEKYPFASLFSLLYLKALANGKSVDLDSALQQHAYRLNDRRQLFQLVHTGGVVLTERETETEAERTIEAVAVGATSISVPEIPVTEEVAEVLIPDVAHAPIEAEHIIESLAEPTAEAELVAEVEPLEGAEIDAVSEEVEDVISFEQMTDAFTMEQAFELETVAPLDVSVDAKSDNLVVSDAPAEAQPEEATDSTQVSGKKEEAQIDHPLSSSPLPPSQGGSPADPAVAEAKRSFTDWLKSSHPEISGLEQELPPAAKPVATPPAAEENLVKPKVEEIIDTFIREEPTITRNKTEFFSPSKKAKESLDEDALPVSETLAKIYAAQGNYPKAIHVYHQLMLSVPEKRSLFAVQIEELKKKITP